MRQVTFFKQKFPLPHLFKQATKANTMTWLGSNKKNETNMGRLKTHGMETTVSKANTTER
jgi:hypothetical protein